MTAPISKTKARKPVDVTRHISAPVAAMLWGRAAGRCQFHGCNKPLWKSEVTSESVNIAQRAHIYSFSDGGPRGNEGVEKDKLNDFDNLLLVCYGCHKKIDKESDGGRYTAKLLREWKRSHEARIELVTDINPSKKSHVVLYGSNVGDENVNLNFADAASALFPKRYPAEDRGIELSLKGNVAKDDTRRFYEIEASNLIGAFNELVKPGVRNQRILHASIFALAPQPLLVLLGTLLNDISEAEVFQRHREPEPTWEWAKRGSRLNLEVHQPSDFAGKPALVFALSDFVNESRITDVLGKEVSLWQVTVKRPSMELVKSRAQLSEFRNVVRDLLGEINRVYGLEKTLHIFPVMGVSPAVELGRMRMPKASMPWQIYDQVSGRGFVSALSIPFKENL